MADVQSMDKPSLIKTCKDLSAHFIALIQRKMMTMMNYTVCLTGMTFQSATKHLRLADSYPVSYHSTGTTNISNDSLKKMLPHTATKDAFTVFFSKELLEFSKENTLYTVSWQNKAEASHRDLM